MVYFWMVYLQISKCISMCLTWKVDKGRVEEYLSQKHGIVNQESILPMKQGILCAKSV